MKQFALDNPGGKRKVIGSVRFTYDKAFYRHKPDRTPKYVPNTMSINIYEGETEDMVRKDVAKWYKNARDISFRWAGDQGGSL